MSKENAQAASQLMSSTNSSSGVNYVGTKRNNNRYQNQRGSQKVNQSSGHGSKVSSKSYSANSSSSSVVCSRCTRRGHSSSKCNTKCYLCNQFGHIKAKCPNGGKKRTGLHGVDEDGADSSQTQQPVQSHNNVSDDLYLFHVETSKCNSPNDALLESTSFENPTNLSSCMKINDNNINNSENCTKFNSGKPILNVLIENKALNMELDTGAVASCISLEQFNSLGFTCNVAPVNKSFRVANGHTVNCVGIADVQVKFRGSVYSLKLHLIDSRFPVLLGRDWIRKIFGDDWLENLVSNSVHQLKGEQRDREAFIQSIKTSPVFSPGLGLVKEFKASLDLKPESRAKFCKARPIPYSLKERVGSEIDRMEAAGILCKVDHSDYASPVVPIVKPDKSIRICGDYKSTVNPNLDTKVYPLPVVEDCFSEMVGGKLFSKVDIKQAYNNIELREQDQIITTINTHKGLYKWTRLPYGISSSSAIFQSVMDQVLQGIPGCVCRVDDILITGRDDAEHMARLREVIHRLEKAGFKCKLDKSKFMEPMVVYIGYEVSEVGVRPCQSKVETIQKAPYPTNLPELISFLGGVNYYARYIPNLSTLCEPLNQLRTKDWKFGSEEKQAFDKLRSILSSSQVLTFYDPNLPLQVASDASSFGLGAVLSHILPSGEERPVEFVSRTLSKTERNYSQIEKEALSIIWAVKRWHRYLYARKFTLYTDHKPLLFIFHQHKQVPEMSISRIQRWALALACYEYEIKFRATDKHSNADVCSRFPLKTVEDEYWGSMSMSNDGVYSLFDLEDKVLLNSSMISHLTKTDQVLAKVLYFTLHGWPAEKGDLEAKKSGSQGHASLKPFYQRRADISTEQGCLLWGSRVIIPEKLQASILDLLHCTHMGMSSTKALARGYVWFPGLDQEIERLVKSCETCQLQQKNPEKAVPHPWTHPKGPWERIHIDFCQFHNIQWLIVIDAFSKWLEVARMGKDTTSRKLINVLRTIFSRLGLPLVLVSDNGPQLVSTEFEEWLTKNSIHHITTPTYSPASNGFAESLVGKFKTAMTKMLQDNSDILTCLSNWLMMYRNTPQSSTGLSPSEHLYGRKTRTALSIINPLSNHSKVKVSHLKQEQKAIESPVRTLEVGQQVLYRDILSKEWCKGIITALEGSKIYRIKCSGTGTEVRKVIDQVVPYIPQYDGPRERVPSRLDSEVEKDAAANLYTEPLHDKPVLPPSLDSNSRDLTPDAGKLIADNNSGHSALVSDQIIASKPKRSVKPPDRLVYSKLGGD